MDVLYIQLKKDVHVHTLGTLYFEDIAQISTMRDDIRKIPIYTISKKDEQHIVIDSFIVLTHVQKLFPDCTFHLVGPSQCLIHINENEKKASVWKAIIAWIILFIGTAMTIINFHYDVSMQEVQQKLHFLLTGEKNDFPLLIQIPYSFGLGIGMLLFFNYWFKKKFTDEPSPLEIELFNYQKQVDAYTLARDAIEIKDTNDE